MVGSSKTSAIKILFVAHSFKNGGAEKYLYDLVVYCHGKGFSCLVIGPGSGPYNEKFSALGVSVKSIKLGSLFFPAKRFGRSKRFLRLIIATWKMVKEILTFSPNVVYSNTSAVLAGGLAARIACVPHIWHIHENITTFKLYMLPVKILRYLVKKLSRRVIFVSQLALKSIFPEGFPDNAMVIHNGVRLDPLQVCRLRIKKTNTEIFRDGCLSIGFIGSIIHRKGLDILVSALAEIYKKCPKVYLEVWGEGDFEYLRYIRNLCNELGVSKAIRFIGYAEDVQSILPNYDVVVIPSRAESFGLVAIEAMAAGIPVIATRCGGPEEFIEDGVNGYLVSPDDSKGIAEALLKVYGDRSNAIEMAKRGREKAWRDFNLEVQLSRIVDVIQEVAR